MVSRASLWQLALPTLLGLPAFAQTPPPALRDPADRVFREQTERERERNVELAPPAPIRPTDAVPGAAEEDSFPADLPADGPSFQIRSIAASGDAILDAAAFARITAPFVGRSLGAAHIRVLLDRLNRALTAQGNLTSKAMVANQNLAEGHLVVDFLAGRVERIVFDGREIAADGWSDPGVRMALPFRAGDVLKLQDIEQAVDQFNRVRGTNVQVQIQPGQQVGGSIVRLQNTPGAARQFMLSLDSQGGAATGRWRTQASVEQGNALGLMETLSLGLTTSRDTNAVYGAASIPWGNNTVSFMGSWSEYLNLVGDTALVYGTSRNTSVAFNHLLQRDQTSKTALDVSLARRGSERAINNAALTPQTLTVVRLGVNRLTRQADGSQWTIDGAWVQGLRALGALRDADDLPPGAAQAQFTKFELSGSLQRPLGGEFFKGTTWRARLHAQWSGDALYSSEQIFAGGVSSVRGFAESAVGGDRGVVLRNELVREGWWLGANGRARIDPYVFVDAARVYAVAGGRGESLASAGVGLRISFLYGSSQGAADIVVGRPIKRPHARTEAAPSISMNLSYFF